MSNYNPIDIDELFGLLKSAPSVVITGGYNPESKTDFDRTIKFSVRGKDYEIEWYKNISYLYIGEVKIPFYNVSVSGTWPNRFKNNLQFVYAGGETICIMPIEEY